MTTFPPEIDLRQGESWQFVQAAGLLRRNLELHRRALMLLSGVDADLGEEAPVELTADEVAELEALGADICDLGGQLRMLTETLSPHPATVSYNDLLPEADQALAEGSFDPERALIAATVLPMARGWHALAECLLRTDAHRAWDDLTTWRLLTAFRGADERAVRTVLAESGLGPDTELAACDRDDATRLARALRRYLTPRR